MYRTSLQALARRLDEATAAGGLDNGAALAAVLDALQLPGSPTASPAKEEQPPLAAAGSLEPAGSLQRNSSLQVQQPAAAAAAADGVTAAWQTLLVPLAAVARLDGRPRAADAAAAVLLQVFKLHGDSLSPQQWQRLYQAILLPLLALPTDPPVAGTAPGVAAAGSSSSGTVELVSRRTTTGGGSAAESLPTAVSAALSFEGLDRCACATAARDAASPFCGALAGECTRQLLASDALPGPAELATTEPAAGWRGRPPPTCQTSGASF